MKKKAPENVQETASKLKKTNTVAGSHSGNPGSVRGNKPSKPEDDPRFAQAVQNYEAGLRFLQTHKYDKAKACFEKVVGGPSPQLNDRAAVHLSVCKQHLDLGAASFKSPEEQYDYAVSLMNTGDYLGAREVFEDMTQKHPTLDYVWYGAGALQCLMGHFPDAISRLSEAIRLNPANRFQARNDVDFKSMADDPRFTELLYPDVSVEGPADPDHKWHF